MSRRREAVGPAWGLALGPKLFLLALIAAGLMITDHRQQHLAAIRDTLSVLLFPLQAVVNLPFATWHWASDATASREALMGELNQLREDRLDLQVQLQRLAALEAENARLRAMMGASRQAADRVLVAEILAVDLDPFRHRFTVNKGNRHGVHVGQALLDANGVLGQVVRVQPLTAEAIMISDADHALPVIVNRNGLRTIAMGTGDTERLSLPFLPNSADIEEGDLLVSSGLGGTFPSGYPVATVRRIERRPGEAFAQISAEPAAGLLRAREVLLVWTSHIDEDDGPGEDPEAAGNEALADASGAGATPDGQAP
ncbi:MAG: rod shape-determining protein MreC [Gammaproteobacteria bacterium]|nr:rod shape-determining protein MreC [Gammaproteobacteria bacterium]